MRIPNLVLAAHLALAATSVRADTKADAMTHTTDVPVTRIVLYSSGVGYFEHTGTVNGNAHTELRFKTAQINDMLKSLVLQDLGGGTVGTVVYPSQDPLEKTLKSFQVDISGNPSLAELLRQLRGAQVTVEAPALGATIEGTILGVEQQQRPAGEGEPINVWVLNVLSHGTIRAVELNAVNRLELTNPELQEELSSALAALAQARDQDKKPVTLNFSGQGERQVRIGYVVETPIWKTSYRLVLPGDKDAKAKLQGWAIVENQTESDWDDVSLALVSGRPISFVQDLYQPLYVPRPVVQPELYASLSPQMYQEGVEEVAGDQMERFAGRSRGVRRMAKAASPAPATETARGGFGGGGYGGMAGGSPFSPASPAMDVAASVASMATAADVGELFEYNVPDVSLPRQRSAMIPIITDDVAVTRLSIYNQSVLAEHPLNGVRLTNTTGKHIMQGPVTVIDDGAYAGDARVNDVPEGQERLLSYAVDLDVRVKAENLKNDQSVQTASLVKGVLQLKRKQVLKQDYVIDNKGDRDRKMLIEHPVHGGYALVDTPEPVEKTETLYRFEDDVAAGKTAKLTVTEERVYSETIAVLPADLGQLVSYSRMGEIPQDVRQALAEVIRRKQALVDTDRKIQDRTQQIQTVTTEQERIRENMKTVDKASQYYARMLEKLDTQENQIEKLQAEIMDLRATRDRQQADLEQYIGGLNIG
ncbi:MAG TPA: DUF4139 domain-containing protein [Phycisphaerae bacterium]|nr:DUF4139 domain-containing protein [Phycisphaerales bacterium]HRX85466.1 DUF4139 domain-containing protein [Phycisphaerae bacterium]